MAKRAVLQLTIRVYGMEGSSSVVKSCLDSRCLRREREEESRRLSDAHAAFMVLLVPLLHCS